MTGGMRGLVALAALALLAGCNVIPKVEGPRPAPSPRPTTRPTPRPTPAPSATPAPAPVPETALLLGIARGRGVGSLGLAQADAAAALASFVESCPRLLARTDGSGLTRADDWRPACAAAPGWNPNDAAGFFKTWFETAVVGDGKAFATGYYEPEISGVRTRQPGFDVPVYALPADMARGWPDEIPPAERTGNPPLGRRMLDGKYAPYYSRGEIEDGALAGKGLEIAWAADPVEFFFLQVQGSGRLRAPDGTVMRIGYAGQNGRDYTGIGGVMRDRGLIGDQPGQYAGSMQGIMAYLREHPADGDALMRENKSWVFFKELIGDGPLGALSVPVRAESSVAADPKYVPLGAPVFLDMDNPRASGLWIAQDTGGAIKGANRFDTFWGAGEQARLTAGGMSARGQAVLLLPKGTLLRLGVN
ncbi:MAG: murein transglycosylase A [Candidatus Andeanibacterium colombiense]|uniref:peptidoglycan lytic exotransglycosylase n=1 Tax=Candidatus Andeanibacterium colombiense TaxID=3121345 RepID=A0AAJ5X881_9SPHN|nr:MAG: murein transglycosylase A [Sphingomonadaceae bacterium]